MEYFTLHALIGAATTIVDYIGRGFVAHPRPGPFLAALVTIFGTPALLMMFAGWRCSVKDRGGTIIPRPHRLLTVPLASLWKKTLGRPKAPAPFVPYIYLAWQKDDRLVAGGYHTRIDPRTHGIFRTPSTVHNDAEKIDSRRWLNHAEFDKAVTWGTMHARVHPPMEVKNFSQQATFADIANRNLMQSQLYQSAIADVNIGTKFHKAMEAVLSGKNLHVYDEKKGLYDVVVAGESPQPHRHNPLDGATAENQRGVLQRALSMLRTASALPRSLYLSRENFNAIFGVQCCSPQTLFDNGHTTGAPATKVYRSNSA